jgi:hypothetical protein
VTWLPDVGIDMPSFLALLKLASGSLGLSVAQQHERLSAFTANVMQSAY